ncbi:MAG TPA: hypothetical protein VNG71_15645 [Pyrinomonadaceae bacterium]|nr:hypothetical protein [Pyrinomonadaceae bacterium]
MNSSVILDLLKIAFLVIIALLTAWLREYYVRRRRSDSYREHLFKQRLEVYRELWQRYVRLTRTLGTKGASLTAIGVAAVHSKLPSGQIHVARTDSDGTHVTNAEPLLDNLTNEIDEFISFARGAYILLDPDTVKSLEAIVQLIEGKSEGDGITIDWGALHDYSFLLQDRIRAELGIDKLRDMNVILRSQRD